MKVETEIIEIRCNGKMLTTIRLNRETPGTALYLENGDIAKEFALGKSKKQAKIDANRRAAFALFYNVLRVIEDMKQIDNCAANILISELHTAILSRMETMTEKTTNFEELEQAAAAHCFAFYDAVSELWDQSIEEAGAFVPACLDALDMSIDGKIPSSERMKQMQSNLKEARTKPRPVFSSHEIPKSKNGGVLSAVFGRLRPEPGLAPYNVLTRKGTKKEG